MARILAKSLNCRSGKTTSPCNNCDLCKGITEGTCMDVIEIDAASNRGIDEMRQIRDRVNYSPVEGKYKVYIIDEVHMLTEQAFNALLKTLEEPPVNTLFVLATTDPQKVPITILSRCQRLDFSKIPPEQIIGHIKKIATEESVNLDDRAAHLIAKKADGGLRDAISLMDQVIAFSGNNITPDDVLNVIGTSSIEFLVNIATYIIEKNSAKLLEELDELINQGKNIPQIIKDIIDFYRSILFVKMGVTKSLEATDDQLSSLKELSNKYTLDQIKHTISIFSKTELDMRWHPNARLLLEIAFVDLTIIETVTNEPQPQKQVVATIKKDTIQQPAKVQNGSSYTKPTAPTPSSATVEPTSGRKAFTDMKSNLSTPKPITPESTKTPPIPEIPVEQVDPSEITLPTVKHHWADVLQKVKLKKMRLGAFLSEATPVSVENGKITIQFGNEFSFHKDQVSEKKHAALITEAFNQSMATSINVKFILKKEMKTSPDNTTKKQSSSRDNNVDQLVSLFDGKIV
jgi:DNA polymerase-3 subunit gamma/tau